MEIVRQKGFREVVRVLEEEDKDRVMTVKMVLERFQSKARKEEQLARALHLSGTVADKEEKIRMLEEERMRLEDDVAALKADGDFLTSGEVLLLQEDLRELEELISVIQLVSSGPNTAREDEEDKRQCPVCVQTPGEVYGCSECQHWVCGKCREQLVHCPAISLHETVCCRNIG
jgi:hypothetical protein